MGEERISPSIFHINTLSLSHDETQALLQGSGFLFCLNVPSLKFPK